MSRPARLALELEDGPMELTEEETAKIYKMADAEGVTPEQLLKSGLRMMHLLTRHKLLPKE